MPDFPNNAVGTETCISLLRWAGSKRKLLPKLSAFWGRGYPRYIEPFMGSACLFFELNPPAALLGDLNGELVATFETIRDCPDLVHAALHALPKGRESYEFIRSVDPKTLSQVQRSVRFMFLNRYCFNGLYRTNAKGQFNVPFSDSRTGSLPTSSQVNAAANRLATASVFRCDFEELIWENVRAGDFVYLDPPYAVGNRRIFREYDPETFALEDLWRLAESLEEIERRGAHFLLSYATCTIAQERFSKWKSRKVSTTRNIAGFSGHRKRAFEMLYTNIPDALVAPRV